MEWLAAISPLTPVVSLGLILLSGVTSMISASLGVGGGTLLIMTMAQVMPAAALIPVHGMVQLGSNGGRLAMSWRHVHWPLLAAFVPGALVGALVASWLLVRLPSGLLELSIAAFVLYSLWGQGLPKRALGYLGTLVAGAVTTLLSSFVGASGPMVGGLRQAARHLTPGHCGHLRCLHDLPAPDQGLCLWRYRFPVRRLAVVDPVDDWRRCTGHLAWTTPVAARVGAAFRQRISLGVDRLVAAPGVVGHGAATDLNVRAGTGVMGGDERGG